VNPTPTEEEETEQNTKEDDKEEKKSVLVLGWLKEMKSDNDLVL
jgi:hypothetical protein